jgi:hypothetical protein
VLVLVRVGSHLVLLVKGQDLLDTSLNPISLVNLLTSRATVRIFRQKRLEENANFTRDVGRDIELCSRNLFVQVLVILTSEWKASTKEGKQ